MYPQDKIQATLNLPGQVHGPRAEHEFTLLGVERVEGHVHGALAHVDGRGQQLHVAIVGHLEGYFRREATFSEVGIFKRNRESKKSNMISAKKVTKKKRKDDNGQEIKK